MCCKVNDVRSKNNLLFLLDKMILIKKIDVRHYSRIFIRTANEQCNILNFCTLTLMYTVLLKTNLSFV